MSDETRTMQQAASLPRWRHVKRGTEYVEIGRAEVQVGTEPGFVVEGEMLVVYQGSDGKLWAREASEFEDGRFESITTPPVPAAAPMTDEQEGWVLVPKEPTREMMIAVTKGIYAANWQFDPAGMYAAMLAVTPYRGTPAAAPQPKAGEAPQTLFTEAEFEDAGAIGERDGYNQAAADIDRLTGGDGEYVYGLGNTERHCPSATAMIDRIVERFQALERRAALSAPASPDLRALAQAALKDFDDLVGDSEGLYGYHRNGDMASWDEFEGHLHGIDALRVALEQEAGR